MNIFWIILACVDAVFLLIFFKGQNAVWGGLIMGALTGLLVAGGFAVFGDSGFVWVTVAKWAIGCTLFGAIIEVIIVIDRHVKAE